MGLDIIARGIAAGAQSYAADAKRAKEAAEAAAAAAEESATLVSDATHFTDFDTNYTYIMAWGMKDGYPVLRLTAQE